MVLHWFKSFLPRGFYGRATLILVVPIVTIQIVLSIVFIQRHFERVTEQLTGAIVLDLGYIVDQLDQTQDRDAALSQLVSFARAQQIDISFTNADAPLRDARRIHDLAGVSVIATLRAGLSGYRAVDLESDSAFARLWLDTPHGVLEISMNRNRLSPSNPHQLLVIVLLASIVMTFIAILFLRNQVRPIRRLAAAAEAFGKGRAVRYRPAGAAEVRAAGQAFLDMRDRIERQIEQRTLMLSGVSHDMRTPLTRMRLTLAMMPEDEDTRALADDAAEMEALLDSFLDFARGQALVASEPVDPAALIRRVINNRAHGKDRIVLHLDAAAQPPVVLRTQLVERALDNLIGNALRYAEHAEIRLHRTADGLEISVEDDGPGIAPSQRDRAKRPFVRLDAARNQDRGGGVGLGLAIAEDAMRSHGGALLLDQSPALGGLRARLVLPQ